MSPQSSTFFVLPVDWKSANMLCLKRDGQLRRKKEQFPLIDQDLEWFMKQYVGDTQDKQQGNFPYDYFTRENNKRTEQE